MSNTPLVYTIEKASERIGIDVDNFQSLYIEGKLRLAFLNIYNDEHILSYLPQNKIPGPTNLNNYLRDNPTLDESLLKHLKSDLPFFYLSSFALSVHLTYDQEIKSPLVEYLKGNWLLLVQKRFNPKGLYFTDATFSLENPIIPIEEIKRYLKTYGSMKSQSNVNEPYSDPNNYNEEGVAIAYFANKFHQENKVLPKPKQLAAYMLESNNPRYITKQYGKPSDGMISINGSPIKIRHVGERAASYLKEEFKAQK